MTGHDSVDALVRLLRLFERLGLPVAVEKREGPATCLEILGEVVVPSDQGFEEAHHLTFNNVKVDSRSSPQMLEVMSKASKTDRFRKGVTICVGKTGDDLCPVSCNTELHGRRQWTPFHLRRWSVPHPGALHDGS